MKDDQNIQGFNRALLQFLKDVKLWLFFISYLALFRVVFILYFKDKIDAPGRFQDIILTNLNGLRFDSMVASYGVLISFLAVTVPSIFSVNWRHAERFRFALASLFIVLTSVLWVVTFSYFKEFNEQFNYFVFNLYYDDTKAILQTIWADYHPVAFLLLLSALSWAMIALNNRFLKTHFGLSRKIFLRTFLPVQKLLIVLLAMAALLVGLRGSWGSRPMQRKDAATTTDEFLNKAVVNPYIALVYAIQDQRRQTRGTGLADFLPDGNVRKAAQELFRKQASYDDLDSYLLRHAKGPKGTRPRHIFLFVMESYDSWPFLKKYESLGLTKELSALAREGINFENFLPSSSGTMDTLSSIMTGVIFTGVKINYQPLSRSPYPSSIFETFKRLGYRTRLFYGGYLSWQRFGDFARDQGAEEIYGAPHMSSDAATHEWGVDDEYLMDFIIKTANDERPSFNLVMTTSYHPPYNVDVWAKGFHLKEIPGDLASVSGDTTSLKILGHLWYSDKCLGDFVKKAETRLPNALFAFTGDHYGRKFINSKPDFFERSGVPFIIYGKDVLREIRMPHGAAGSHIDIGPTLIELAAPKGFTYYSMGQDMLEARKEYIGIGWHRLIGKDFILDMSDGMRIYPLPGRGLPKDPPDVEVLKSTFNRYYGVGWWRVKRGPKL